jgi:hypothetical protein
MDRSEGGRKAPAGTVRSAILAVALLAAGCSALRTPVFPVYEGETFEAQSPFARILPVSPAVACDAARRALLGQGYVVHQSGADRVGARKSFQPRGESHVQIEFHVVCAPAGPGSAGAVAFVSAVEDRYTLRKTSSSASVGVGPIGSISVPFGSTSDSLVKIASKTIPAGHFYQRFFDLVEHQLADFEEMEAEGVRQ